jgi:putative DNA primase/helicase
VRISAEERDLDLPEKLRGEWSGILQWAIDGCLAWQKGGLAPPSVVVNATVEYLESEDAIALWLEERCIVRPSHYTTLNELFTSWAAWACRGLVNKATVVG